MTKIVFVTADDMSTSVVHLFCLLAMFYSGMYIALYISCDKINITVSSIYLRVSCELNRYVLSNMLFSPVVRDEVIHGYCHIFFIFSFL